MPIKSSSALRVLAVGDVIGRPGRKFLKRVLPKLKMDYDYDALVVNVENAAGGFGMTQEIYREFLEMGIDVMTSGNHIYDKKGFENWFGDADKLLRPLNFPPGSVGRGMMVVEVDGVKMGVLNLIGRVFMKTYDCPFRAAESAMEELLAQTPIVLVDLHAEATSEKMSMGWFLSGKASFLWGTHTHIPTADARILDGHTGYQSDLGMTGPYDSVIGMKKEPVVEGFLTLHKNRFEVAKDDLRLGAAVIDIDRESGACVGHQSLFLTQEQIESADAS